MFVKSLLRILPMPDCGGQTMRSMLKSRRRSLFWACLVFGIGLFGLGLFGGTPATSSANANCIGQELAGRWYNKAKPDGSDILSAEIQIPCSGPLTKAASQTNGPGSGLGLQLVARCMHVLSCDWQRVPVTWVPPTRPGENAKMTARYDQSRFDRLITIEPTNDGKLILSMTSRLKGLGVTPVHSTYVLERNKA